MMKTQENIFLVSASVHDFPLSECGHYLRLLCCASFLSKFFALLLIVFYKYYW